jgi:hypothetical protein
MRPAVLVTPSLGDTRSTLGADASDAMGLNVGSRIDSLPPRAGSRMCVLGVARRSTGPPDFAIAVARWIPSSPPEPG